jgi:uncharacterized protein (TIGR02186 family)
VKRALILAALLLLAAPAGAEDIVSGLGQDVIEITSNYTGSDIVVFGTIERSQTLEGRDIVIVVRGPATDITVRRRDRIAGVWINRDTAKLQGMPGYYYLASTQPLAKIAPPAALVRYGIGIEHLEPTGISSHHDPEPFRQAALRRMRRAGLYAETPGSIDFLSENLFRTHVPVPADVARGQYNVEVYLFRDGQIVSAQSTPLFIDQTGIERRLFNFAHNNPFGYGLAAVFMALAMGWLSSLLFRRTA